MNTHIKMFLVTFTIIFSLSLTAHAQNSTGNRGKSVYTADEIKLMCGVPIDTVEMKTVLAKQDSVYKEYIEKKKSTTGLNKIGSIPNWKNLMSDVDDQGTCGSCWVHAAVGIAEGQLQILYGSRIGNYGIDMDEAEVPDACNGGFPTEAENYIQTDKISSEVGSYPNLDGVKWDIISYSTISGINAIKSALANGPVAACFYVYDDFWEFFNELENSEEVYHYDGVSSLSGGHAVVIVSYDDDNDYWLCKNSWGSSWADDGYFRIGYGECGIESWENSKVTVNSSCYAKITPNLFPHLNDALSYSFVDGEEAYVLPGTNTLTGNALVPSNSTLNIDSDANINLSGHSIISTGGTISKSGGVTINGLRATLYHDGTELTGLCGTIQAACNNATSTNEIYLENGNFNENVTIYNKDNLAMSGSPYYNHFGTLTVESCDVFQATGFGAKKGNNSY